MTRDSALVIRLWGWTLRIDGYGLSLFDTHRFDTDAERAELAELEAGHDCRRDHPDGPCDLDDDRATGAFRESDLEDLLWRARNGDDPTMLMAEFHAGVRADPERPVVTTVERSAAAVWRDGVMEALVAFDPSQPRDEQGQWTSDGSDQSGAGQDAEAKALYAQLLNMPPEQRDAFLAGLNGDQLTRLGKFASLGKATDGPIADIRNKTGQAMQKRGLNPATAGLKSKGGKKKPAAKKKSGGSKGGSGGGKSSGGGSSKKKSSGGGSSGGGSKSSSSKKPAPKKPATKAPAKTAPKPPAKKPTPPPALSPVPGRPRPGVPAPPGGPPRALRSSGSLADWNAARYTAARADR